MAEFTVVLTDGCSFKDMLHGLADMDFRMLHLVATPTGICFAQQNNAKTIFAEWQLRFDSCIFWEYNVDAPELRVSVLIADCVTKLKEIKLQSKKSLMIRKVAEDGYLRFSIAEKVSMPDINQFPNSHPVELHESPANTLQPPTFVEELPRCSFSALWFAEQLMSFSQAGDKNAKKEKIVELEKMKKFTLFKEGFTVQANNDDPGNSVAAFLSGPSSNPLGTIVVNQSFFSNAKKLGSAACPKSVANLYAQMMPAGPMLKIRFFIGTFSTLSLYFSSEDSLTSTNGEQNGKKKKK